MKLLGDIPDLNHNSLTMGPKTYVHVFTQDVFISCLGAGSLNMTSIAEKLKSKVSSEP